MSLSSTCFVSSLIVHELVHEKKNFAWSQLVYQTNEHKRAFYRVELELFMNSLAHLKKMKG